MHGAVGFRVWPSLLALAALLAAWLLLGWDASAQTLSPAGPLVAAEPMPNARVAAAPERIVLTFAAPIDPKSARMRVLGPGGVEIPLDAATVDSDAPERMTAKVVAPLGRGDYTVVWSARAAADGTPLAGAYPFAAGVAGPPGAAGPGQSPQPWAALLRWVVFLGTATAGGGFAWGRLLFWRPGRRDPTRRLRMGAMAGAAGAALLAAGAASFLAWGLAADGAAVSFAGLLLAMPPGWRLLIASLAALVLVCLTVMVSGDAARRGSLDAVGVAAGGAALAGLGLGGHPAPPVDAWALVVEVVHLWAAALWFSGLLFFLAAWRGLGTDVARFRTVRWVGGALLAIAVATGAARAAPVLPSLSDLVASRWGQTLALKLLVVGVVAGLGGVAMLGAGRANAVQASRFLGAQGVGAGLAALLAAVLALLAPPGTAAPATLAGVALAEVVPLDREAFGVEFGIIHLLTQPAMPGAQTVLVRLTAADGTPLTSDATPRAEVVWTPLVGESRPAEPVALQDDPSAAIFIGAATLGAGWQQADVAITPPGGIASRARFWLVVPDPNVSGAGPSAAGDAEAEALYARGLASLTGLQSVRYSQRAGDGSGTLTRTEAAVAGAEGERPAAYAETVIGADGQVLQRQIVVGNRRWVLAEGAWVAAEPIPFLAPAAWGEIYAGAAGFQLGPREAVAGELSQVVTFSTPAGGGSGREPAWYAWWIGLASGQVRRETIVSTREYVVTEYRDFNAELGIAPPLKAPTSSEASTPAATPSAAGIREGANEGT